MSSAGKNGIVVSHGGTDCDALFLFELFSLKTYDLCLQKLKPHGKTMPNARHGYCYFHALRRNFIDSPEYKAMLAAAKNKNDFGQSRDRCAHRLDLVLRKTLQNCRRNQYIRQTAKAVYDGRSNQSFCGPRGDVPSPPDRVHDPILSGKRPHNVRRIHAGHDTGVDYVKRQRELPTCSKICC